MSALPPKADIAKCDRHVRFVPQADIASYIRVAAELLQSCCASGLVSTPSLRSYLNRALRGFL
jgi:hypothetical protein